MTVRGSSKTEPSNLIFRTIVTALGPSPYWLNLLEWKLVQLQLRIFFFKIAKRPVVRK
jgi:hypothetical protein